MNHPTGTTESLLLFVGVIVPLLIAGVWLLLKAFDCGFVMQ